jgi:Predicted membrane protein
MPEWIAIVLRSITTIFVLLAITRLLGKRQITQLTYFEYITGITIGSIAAYVALEDDGRWWLALVSLVTWGIIVLAFEYLTIYSKRIRDLVDGKATVLIKEGKILEDNMKKERYTTDELLQQLRKRNVFNVSDVEFAVLETSGELTVLLKESERPLNRNMLGIRAPNLTEPQTVIMDGKVINEALATAGYSPGWLDAELEKLGVTKENVFLAQVDALGQLHVDLYDDKIELPEPQERQRLKAQLKKCAADLESFALSVQDPAAKSMYAECSEKINRALVELEPYLK